MRKVKGGFILLLFIFSTLLFQFCKKEDDGTFKTYIHKFLFAEFNTKSGAYYNFYKSVDTLRLDRKDTNSFILVSEDTTIQIGSVGIGGNLYATSPTPLPSVDQDSLIIFTLNDFDLLHPAGSNITSCFLISNVYSSSNGLFSVDQFKHVVKQNYLSDFKLHLIKNPTNKTLKLKLHFYTKIITDGIVIQSPTILFKP
ncbi:MAG: hypothetical protein PSX81_14750 [bacterium]|nr:hypothetical protein [bacterium]